MIRPVKPKIKTILAIGAVFAIIAFILFIWANTRPVPARVQIAFIGFTYLKWYYTTNGYYTTNEVFATTTTVGTFPRVSAYFCVSNAGKCSVVNEGNCRYELKFADGSTATLPGHSQPIGELKPGEFKTIPLIPSPDIDPWRVSLAFVRVDWRYRLFQAPPKVVGMIKKFIPARWLVRRPSEYNSDWIRGAPNRL
jgi:hypothetical protein